MSFVDDRLQEHESVLYDDTLILFPLMGPLLLGSLFFMVLTAGSAGVAFVGGGFALLAWPLLVVGAVGLLATLGWSLRSLITSLTQRLVVTDRRVLGATGLLRKRYLDLPHDQVDSVIVELSRLGSVFEYGTVHIAGVDGVGVRFTLVDFPLDVRRHILDLSSPTDAAQVPGPIQAVPQASSVP